MAEIINLPENFIPAPDKEKLESYGAHHISHGQATRYAWERDDEGAQYFSLYRGGADEELAATIHHDMKHHTFYAADDKGEAIVEGSLEHIMTVLEKRFAREHDSNIA